MLGLLDMYFNQDNLNIYGSNKKDVTANKDLTTYFTGMNTDINKKEKSFRSQTSHQIRPS